MPHYTQEQIQKAASMNIAEFLQQQGQTLKQHGNEYEWKAEGQSVSINGSKYFNHYQGKGGNAIHFVEEYLGLGFQDAVAYILGDDVALLNYTPPKPKKAEPSPDKFPDIPKYSKTMSRSFAYLVRGRKIDYKIVQAFVSEGLIRETEQYHNVAFVGRDKDGRVRHISLHGTLSQTSFKKNVPNCDGRYSFHRTGTNGTVYLFEAPIDMLSYISMHPEGWKENTYAASCGVMHNVLEQILKDNPNVDKVHICFDNDEPGQTAARKLKDELTQRNISCDILIPNNKDWNEDLVKGDTQNPDIQTEVDDDLDP